MDRDLPTLGQRPARLPLGVVAREWSRIGITGFGGPPAHIALLRRLCVERKGWLQPSEIEDGLAATSILPGPASTQLAIFCAWRVAGVAGAVVGGLGFILPGLVVIIALSAVFLSSHPPDAVLGAAAGAGAAVPAVALSAARGLVPSSWGRVRGRRPAEVRWVCYAVAGALAAWLAGEYLAAVLVTCGGCEAAARWRPAGPKPPRGAMAAVAALRPRLASFLLGAVAGPAGVGALVLLAFKVGALSYGGGFVIVPLMQHDAVRVDHFMTGAQFLAAVSLGQVTPGPVVLTVAVVGYAAHGLEGAVLATAIAFAPSFLFVCFGASHFDRLRASAGVQTFLTGAGACAIGAIAGASIPLGQELGHLWQAGVAVAAAAWLLGLRRGVVSGLLACGVIGALAAVAGAPV